MKQLRQLLKRFEHLRVIGQSLIQITSLSINSKQVGNGAIFIAIRGYSVDGHAFIEQAIFKGAKVIVCEAIPIEISQKTTYVQVKDSSVALGQISSFFYGDPSKKLKVIGVTGTNGKTTTVTLLFQLFEKLGHRSGLISTIEYRIGEKKLESINTTPNAIIINYLLSEMVKQSCSYCFMEVSSHSVVQNRISGINFAGGIFTNITHEHLDYHKTFENYRGAKQKFFSFLPKDAFALFNKDDDNGNFMVNDCKAKKYSFSIKTPSDFQCLIEENTFRGLKILINNEFKISSPLIGQFNSYNLTGVFAAAILLNQQHKKIQQILQQAVGAEGRFTPVISENGPIGIVDYAHTPDALKKVLSTLNLIKTMKQKITTIVGCGGNRDRQKRPMMASIASQLSDNVILTADNPRFEELQQILQQMVSGVKQQDRKRVKIVQKREEAIREGWEMGGKGDIILVAGKGHEKHQQIKGKKYTLNDVEILESLCKERI